MKTRSLFSMAGLLLATLLTLSCSILEEVKNGMSDLQSALSASLLTGLQFMASEGIPEGEESIITGVQFIAANGNSPYGTLIFTSNEELSELYLQVAGEDGYYVKTLTSADIANKASDSDISYSVDLDFAPDIDANNQKILVSGRSKSGKTSETKESKATTIEKYSCNANKYIEGDEAGFIGSFNMGKSSGSFTFSYDTQWVPDEITIYNGTQARGTPIFYYPSGGTNGERSEVVRFSEANITIKVVGSASGTWWGILVPCP